MFPAQFFPFPEGFQIVELIGPTHQVDTGAVDSGWVPIAEYEGNIALCLDAALASAGTTPTLTIAVTHRVDSNDAGDTLPSTSLINPSTGAAASFAVVTGAANAGLQVLGLVKAEARAQIKVTATVAGTSTPTFDFNMFLVASNKYGAF